MTNPVIKANGTQYWHKNGKLHRENGPAILYPDGLQYWYKNDKLHCEDGPAVLYVSGYHTWWLNGMKYEFDEYIKIRFPTDCKEKMVFLLKWSDK